MMTRRRAANGVFDGRVAHGYFIVSAAAGLFVDPALGPVLANYGMERLRFTKPVYPGDTIQVRLTVQAEDGQGHARGRHPAGRGGVGRRGAQPARRGGGGVLDSHARAS